MRYTVRAYMSPGWPDKTLPTKEEAIKEAKECAGLRTGVKFSVFEHETGKLLYWRRVDLRSYAMSEYEDN